MCLMERIAKLYPDYDEIHILFVFLLSYANILLIYYAFSCNDFISLYVCLLYFCTGVTQPLQLFMMVLNNVTILYIILKTWFNIINCRLVKQEYNYFIVFFTTLFITVNVLYPAMPSSGQH